MSLFFSYICFPDSLDLLVFYFCLLLLCKSYIMLYISSFLASHALLIAFSYLSLYVFLEVCLIISLLFVFLKCFISLLISPLLVSFYISFLSSINLSGFWLPRLSLCRRICFSVYLQFSPFSLYLCLSSLSQLIYVYP